MHVRRYNHLLWMGPLLTFVGAVSYFVVFARFPALRDFPWVNLPVVGVGVLLSLAGVRRAFVRGRGRWVGSIALVSSLLIGGLFGFYVFWLSYQLPATAGVTGERDAAPDFTLTDQHGQPLTLSSLRGRKVVLVFYRGHW